MNIGSEYSLTRMWWKFLLDEVRNDAKEMQRLFQIFRNDMSRTIIEGWVNERRKLNQQPNSSFIVKTIKRLRNEVETAFNIQKAPNRFFSFTSYNKNIVYEYDKDTMLKKKNIYVVKVCNDVE